MIVEVFLELVLYPYIVGGVLGVCIAVWMGMQGGEPSLGVASAVGGLCAVVVAFGWQIIRIYAEAMALRRFQQSFAALLAQKTAGEIHIYLWRLRPVLSNSPLQPAIGPVDRQSFEAAALSVVRSDPLGWVMLALAGRLVIRV